ncbi:MAG: hypothetical protein HDT28_08010 [Clostridiales bacterium]|nr:hypothetical protein [Clostridiales bacterium]
MDNYPPSKTPIKVTVSSDLEPVKGEGFITERDDGFTVEFNLLRDKFTIEHSVAVTRIVTEGDMSYTIELCEAQTSTVLATPYGAVRFAVKTLERTVERMYDKLHIILKYILASEAAGELERSIIMEVEKVSK